MFTRIACRFEIEDIHIACKHSNRIGDVRSMLIGDPIRVGRYAQCMLCSSRRGGMLGMVHMGLGRWSFILCSRRSGERCTTTLVGM